MRQLVRNGPVHRHKLGERKEGLDVLGQSAHDLDLEYLFAVAGGEGRQLLDCSYVLGHGTRLRPVRQAALRRPTRPAARTRLAHLAQTNTVAEYLTTLKELTFLATSNCDEECKLGFMSGLAKDIQTCVALAQPATVGEVIANALSEDCTSLGEAYQREQQQPPLTAGRLSMTG